MAITLALAGAALGCGAPATASGSRPTMPAVETAHTSTEPLVITAIDVGQGDCTLLECPNGAEVLVDCGSSAAGDRDRVAALLDEHIDGELEVLVVTHPDADHINFLAPTADGSVLGEREIGRALLSLDEAAYRETETGERLMDWLDMRGADVHFLTPSDASTQDQPSSLFECGDTEVYILAASEPSASHDRALQRNTPSIVLLVERTTGGRRFRAMLTGDATRETEAAILARYPPAFLDVDLLKVGHHGALTSTVDPNDPSWRWLAATTPRHALTTAGHHGGHGHPRCAVTGALLELGTLDPAACHALECADPDACDGERDGRWCASVSNQALFNSANNGTVTWTFDGRLSVAIERGTRPRAECAIR